MAQATSKDKEVLGDDGECCTHTNQCGNYHILSRGYCPTWYAARTIDLWGLADS